VSQLISSHAAFGGESEKRLRRDKLDENMEISLPRWCVVETALKMYETNPRADDSVDSLTSPLSSLFSFSAG
jgi:hypothetical protein